MKPISRRVKKHLDKKKSHTTWNVQTLRPHYDDEQYVQVVVHQADRRFRRSASEQIRVVAQKGANRVVYRFTFGPWEGEIEWEKKSEIHLKNLTRVISIVVGRMSFFFSKVRPSSVVYIVVMRPGENRTKTYRGV